ncbi:Flp pilus assembly protein CpaB [Cohnella suwonensis]|uniref:Flp pilus assembly protein CpaB n=1 Tax=Cohnella suwonensis TaxID=696072 RepID=A0ABW0LUE1_9BACL
MRSKLILIAALLMGVATTLLFFNYMKQYKEAPADDTEFVNVVAVKQDVRENTKLSSGMLEIIQVPMSGAHAHALTSPTEADGKVTASNLVAGEVLLANHLKDQKEEAQFVSKKVRSGYRAVSIGVNIVQSVSNLIEPGDYVDVVFTKKEKITEQVVSTELLKNVHVLAIGRRMVEAEADTPYEEYAQVTLELQPADGVKIINADEDGDGMISLMLNSRIVQEDKVKAAQ